MQPAAPALPEFHALGREAETAPVRRDRYRQASVLALDRLVTVLQHRAVGDDAALLRDPGTQLAGVGTAVKIGLALLAGRLGHCALDDDLPLQGEPGKYERSVRVGRELAALAALVIGEEDKTAAVDALEQRRAGRRTPVLGGGGNRHGVWLDHLGTLSLLKPFLELAEGVARQILLEESGQGVIFTVLGKGHAGRIMRARWRLSKDNASELAGFAFARPFPFQPSLPGPQLRPLRPWIFRSGFTRFCS